jgi:transposase
MPAPWHWWRQVTRRNQIVRQRARLKTIAQSILHAHLVPQCPHADLFGIKGRAWLLAQHFPEDELEALERHVREYDRIGETSGLSSANWPAMPCPTLT